MPSLTFSITVHQGNSAFSWNTKAMSRGSGAAHRLVVDLDRAGALRQQSADHVEQRALAAAARADQAQQFAARNVERGVEQRADELRIARLAELVRDVPDFDRGVARRHFALVRFALALPARRFGFPRAPILAAFAAVASPFHRATCCLGPPRHRASARPRRDEAFGHVCADRFGRPRSSGLPQPPPPPVRTIASAPIGRGCESRPSS